MSIFLVLPIRVAKRLSATGQARAALRSGCQRATAALEGPLAGRPSHGGANAPPAQFAPTFIQGAPGAGPGGKDRQPLGRGQLRNIDAFSAEGRVVLVWQARMRSTGECSPAGIPGRIPHPGCRTQQCRPGDSTGDSLPRMERTREGRHGSSSGGDGSASWHGPGPMGFRDCWREARSAAPPAIATRREVPPQKAAVARNRGWPQVGAGWTISRLEGRTRFRALRARPARGSGVRGIVDRRGRRRGCPARPVGCGFDPPITL